ncbi:zinc-ribbon domain-containing protein [Ovoidimarina sediminis]|uniref:zinc-ribbon domain-containing protein n=1 Tax=Ovoidimarina sediminis TaxID=3079856 RepID=UPI002913CE26|nr:zinc-ribbon domain-containing protein [Rhodophyticola sp. MJ-SS7]MDU8944031.1 zinc-ribbon domain-containing protein [Rhodophyticola sp. MJ-SS7]
MRLICPNCDAQYEVDAAMIPASGRDVQCSNCGRTWFQEPQAAEPLVLAEEDPGDEAPEFERSGDGLDERAKAFFEGRDFDEPEAPAASESAAQEDDADGWDEEADAGDETEDWDEEDEADAEPIAAEDDDTLSDDEPEAARLAEDADDAPAEAEAEEPVAEAGDGHDDYDEYEGHEAYEDEDEDVPAAASVAVDLPRRKPDAHVLGILRAEAEREIAARRAEEAQAMELQPDLGALDPAPPRPAPMETEARTARLRGVEDEAAEGVQRKSMLPDIDDINATLTATRDRRTPEPPVITADEIARRRTGFRIGFSGVMAMAVLLILVYLYAPQIADAVPGLEGALAAYVDWANGMRLSLDAVLASTVDRITGVAGAGGSEG